MVPKKSKAKNNNPPERRFGIILKDINSKFDQVIESHSATDKKIEDFRGEFDEFRTDTDFKFKTLSVELRGVSEKLSGLEDKYDKNFDQILKYLSRIDEEIQDLKKRLNRKADLERLLLVEQKVAEIQLAIKKIL